MRKAFFVVALGVNFCIAWPAQADLETQSFDSEAAAIKSVFGDRAGEIRAMAIKGAVGNNGAGSGAIDFAASLLAMANNTVPASPNSETCAELRCSWIAAE